MAFLFSILKTFGWLLWARVRSLREKYFKYTINMLILPGLSVIISGFILPNMGLDATYGTFMAVSSMVMMCYSTCAWGGAEEFVADLAYNKSIHYEFTLPLPSWMVFIKYAFSYAIKAMILNIFTLPFSKLLLGSKFNLAHVSLLKFLVIYIVMNFCFGFFTLWIASRSHDLEAYAQFWLRYGSTLLFLGGFQFSYFTLTKTIPILAYINLLNPFTYAFEGLRSTILGQEGSLNYFICVGMLVVFALTFCLRAIVILKRRLDCL